MRIIIFNLNKATINNIYNVFYCYWSFCNISSNNNFPYTIKLNVKIFNGELMKLRMYFYWSELIQIFSFTYPWVNLHNKVDNKLNDAIFSQQQSNWTILWSSWFLLSLSKIPKCLHYLILLLHVYYMPFQLPKLHSLCKDVPGKIFQQGTFDLLLQLLKIWSQAVHQRIFWKVKLQ
jgi:hypothetical protein